MARYRGATNRLSRREGIDLGLKSNRRNNERLEKRLAKPPGQAVGMRRKPSNYGIQLREKQKMKRIYGLLERQFRIFFQRAAKKGGIKGENLIQLLERRLDNTVYRLLFASTRREARQMVSHGHITVNGKRVNVPSFIVSESDVIGVCQKEATLKRVKEALETGEKLSVPEWLTLNKEKVEGKVLRMPTKADAALPVEESLIVELYSK